MRDPENIRQVATLGVDWMGFIFYSRSPRSISGEQAYADLQNFQFSIFNFQLKRVGVFVNASPEEIMEIALCFKLDYLQLHGDESPEFCHTLQKRGYAIIKAISVASEDDLEQTAAYDGRIDYFLFDTKCSGYGGSGKQFDWSVLAAYQGQIPFLLSGGLNPDSVSTLKHFHHPKFAGIDLNSGFEIEPGIKDVEKLSPFIKSLKSK